MKRRGRPRSPDILTPRESEVLALLRDDLSNDAIARTLGVSIETVKAHVSSILLKLGVESRYEAARWRPEPRPQRGWLAALAPSPLLAKLKLHVVLYAAGATTITVAGVLVAVLLWGIAHDTSSSGATARGAATSSAELAYIQNGDLYVQPLPDGPARRLADDGANNSPKWSPSGGWLLFTDNDRTFVVRSDGSGRRQVEATSWAPNADRLVSMESSGTIIIENADRSDRREITTPPVGPLGSELRGTSVAMSWDGQALAYQKMTATPGATPGIAYDGIWRIDAGGGNAIELYNTGAPPRDGLRVLGWSRDDQAILFQRDLSFSASLGADGFPLEVIPALGGGGQRAATDGTLTGLGWEYQPNGSLIAITDGPGRETWTNKRVAVVDPNGTMTALTGDTMAAFSPAWSPDGSQLAYVSAPAAPGVGGDDPARQAMSLRRIWVMNADGSGKRQLTYDARYRDERPRWSADGSRIVFARIDAQDHASLWSIPSAAGDSYEIVDDLSPHPMPDTPLWFGYYGYVAWDTLFDISSLR